MNATNRQPWYARLDQETFMAMLAKQETQPGKYARGQNTDETEFFFIVCASITGAVLIVGTLIAYILEQEWTAGHLILTGLLAAIPGILTFLLGIGVLSKMGTGRGRYNELLQYAKDQGWR